MEKEPREKPWPRGSDSVLRQLNTTEQHALEIRSGIFQSETPIEQNVSQPFIFKSIAYLAHEGLIEFKRRAAVINGELKPAVAYWRLTDNGAKLAHEKGLISQTDYLCVIHQREQDPDLNNHK